MVSTSSGCARSLIGGVVLLAGASQAYAFDTYSNGQLSIPTVTVGNATYTNMVVGVTPSDIVVPPNGNSANGTVDTYNPLNNQLTIPVATVGSSIYYNVVVTVGSLISIGGVTGVDTYNASDGELTIPSVQFGGAIYTDVVITVGSIVSQGGGMPMNFLDVYNGSNGQLALESIQLGPRVYTNPVITPGRIISLGGQLPVESTLYSFNGSSGNGTDAANPAAGLLLGRDGNFYGTASYGGAYSSGALFEVTPAGVESLQYSFGANGATDGATPESSLIEDGSGNFYGTTNAGGTAADGTVFKVMPGGFESVLYSFGASGSTDGINPVAGVVLGADGNLYGTTPYGGAYSQGIVFQVTPQGAETVLWSFGGNGGITNSVDGASPFAGLIQGPGGNFYGTTNLGGGYDSGTVFMITTAGSLTVLYSFGATANDGVSPYAGLTLGSDGNFYGTTAGGGAYGSGTVFKLTPSGTESIVYSFTGDGGVSGSTDGAYPEGSLTQDANGNFYGTTSAGGGYDSGTAFKVTPAGTELVLYSFSGGGALVGSTDGADPVGSVIQDSSGNFYGATNSGGVNDSGIVFKLTEALTAH